MRPQAILQLEFFAPANYTCGEPRSQADRTATAQRTRSFPQFVIFAYLRIYCKHHLTSRTTKQPSRAPAPAGMKRRELSD